MMLYNDPIFVIGLIFGGFCMGVGITGKLMKKYHKAGWVKPHVRKNPLTTFPEKNWRRRG